jgi:hypothetical protein
MCDAYLNEYIDSPNANDGRVVQYKKAHPHLLPRPSSNIHITGGSCHSSPLNTIILLHSEKQLDSFYWGNVMLSSNSF